MNLNVDPDVHCCCKQYFNYHFMNKGEKEYCQNRPFSCFHKLHRTLGRLIEQVKRNKNHCKTKWEVKMASLAARLPDQGGRGWICPWWVGLWRCNIAAYMALNF